MARARRAGWACGLTLLLAGCASSPATADRDCGDFRDQRAAQRWLTDHPNDLDGLDSDGNGVACESMHAARAVPNGPRQVRVDRVVDGDTIKVSGGETVRLVGIDTPESKKPDAPVECGAERAAAAMRALVLGKAVVLRRDPTQDAIDRYGRTLAYVDVGARDAGEEMIRGGWAKPYVYGGVPFSRLSRYLPAEAAARRVRAGVHGACSGDFHRAG